MSDMKIPKAIPLKRMCDHHPEAGKQCTDRTGGTSWKKKATMTWRSEMHHLLLGLPNNLCLQLFLDSYHKEDSRR